MKLTCRWVVPARIARSNWLIRRAVRQRRSSVGNRDINRRSLPAPGLDAIPCRESSPVPTAVRLTVMRTAEQLNQLVDRYISLWNDPDPDARRKLIREVWRPDGAQVLVDPPQEIRDAAKNIEFPIPPLEVHGYDALEVRVTRAYEMFVAPGEYVFQRSGDAIELLDHVVTWTWDMVTVADGERVGGGADIFVLDEDDRIRVTYQTIAH